MPKKYHDKAAKYCAGQGLKGKRKESCTYAVLAKIEKNRKKKS